MEVNLTEKKRSRHFSSNLWFVLFLVGCNVMISFATSQISLSQQFFEYKNSLPDIFDLWIYKNLIQFGMPEEMIHLVIIIKYSESMRMLRFIRGMFYFEITMLIVGSVLCLVGLAHYRRGAPITYEKKIIES